MNYVDYFGNFVSLWGLNFEGIKKMFEEILGVKVFLNLYKELIVFLGIMFWFCLKVLY